MSTTLNRRQWLAGAAAVGGAAAASVNAQETGQGAAQEPDLAGQSILITGCSSGFGRLAAEHFATLGAKVFATMRNVPRPEAEELRQFASDQKVDLTVLEIDVTKPRQIKKGVAKALAASGGSLDVLVNNAGIAYGGTVELQDEQATKNIFETNVFGPHRMAQAVLPGMRSQGKGLIIQVSSQLGRVIIPGFSQYSPTKFALEAMSEQMAYEVAPQGIEVTIVQPGGYPTKIWDNSRQLTDDLLKRADDDLEAVYADYLAGLENRGGGSTDPMDIPRAMAKTIAMPAGDRPLRLPVHPGAKPQQGINQVSAQTQQALLQNIGMGAIAKAVHNT